MGAEDFLRGMLRDYYCRVNIDSVPDIRMREFGFGEFGRKISSRHVSFSSPDLLNGFLRQAAPFYISYSAARYESPSARPMEKKNLLGADLVYEFDADDIPTECKATHDSWKCRSCGAASKGRLAECPECGHGVEAEEWVCSECLGETKRQALGLLALLHDDFGFSEGVKTNFSGSKGFHVHVRSKEVQQLSKSGRLELLDYVTGANLDLALAGFDFSKSGAATCPRFQGSVGWAKKVLGGARELLAEEADVERIAEMGRLGLPKRGSVAAAGKLLKEKQWVIDSMDRGLLVGGSGIHAGRFWKGVLAGIVEGKSFRVDRQTSVDINKIIRVPGTIHGSTGLCAAEVDVNSLNSFEPLKAAVVLPAQEVRVADASSPKFFLGGEWFGPFRSEEASLPAFAAFYLLARGKAVLAGEGW